MSYASTNGTFQPSTNWREYTIRRLMWLYDDRARAYGMTAEAQSDLKAWRELGRRSAA